MNDDGPAPTAPARISQEVIMKKNTIIIGALLALLVLAGCATPPPPPAPLPSVAKFEILQHKGTTVGVLAPPAWVEAAINGAKAVEKLPEYKNSFVVVVDVSGGSLEGIQNVASRLNADTEISRYLSLRVKDTFAGAQVGDKDKIETYMERCVKSVSEARFSGITKATDWWVQLRWYKPDNPRAWDHDEFRLLQLYTVDKAVLEEQLRAILAGAAADEPKTPEKQRAMDLVQQSFFDGF
jgi:hypothetical protein